MTPPEETFELSPGESLLFQHQAPADESGRTFVFVNALTGDRSMWTGAVAETLAAAGHGYLAWNFRGQAGSETAADTALTPALIVGDLLRLLEARAPRRPVLVGLSIGGLFAIQAHLADARAEALVLINTLRKAGQRLDWINDAVFEAAKIGGAQLVADLYLPLIAGEDLLAAKRAEAFSGGYAPLDPQSGTYRLLRDSRSAQWDQPYEELDLPVLVMTGGRDMVFRVPEDVEDLSARLPRAKRVDYPDLGHLIPAENPRRCARDLLSFVQSL